MDDEEYPTLLVPQEDKVDVPLWRQFLQTFILMTLVTFIFGLAILAVLYAGNADVQAQSALSNIQVPVN